ncbi:hypothetical protein [Halorhodospira halophila]|uniref:hypothetical protein n=1 Tax=Halorhodospira halophila TaxID=1053 RepID=UPI0019140583|nr:hypothetical protein [Halorhodospira halophila]
MRKLGKHDRLRHIQQNRRKLQKRLRRERRDLSKTRTLTPNRDTQKNSTGAIACPTPISLYSNGHYKRTLRFLSRLEQSILAPRPTRIDFSETDRVSADGMLLFTARLMKLQHSGHLRNVRSSPSRTHKVRQVFTQLELNDLLGLRNGRSEPIDDDVIYWMQASGNEVSLEHPVSIIDKLKETDQLDEISARYLFAGVSEAIDNSIYHAYDDPSSPPQESKSPKWWVFSRVENGWLHFLQCDLGIGIPVSLPKKHSYTLIDSIKRKFGLGNDDGHAIKAAMEIATTRTGQPARGRGMPQMKQIIESEQQGRLVIYSNRGWYMYNARTGRDSFGGRRKSIEGTIIVWQVPLY